ncbi:conserved Plasmodium protein, unknown function [Plasmodium gallinaceum]|uniref:Uncharacterized protein n=1 Tax=Plasmodium gallinaceum TaxID=5849 RepID=A0A1J1GVP6_PLAGA|nr:conserved Plasmodium protein, unknown function [Plasmodium gallinaceum]CRG96326.1 conserved Plasmodium protein, unknown function [Plasmodium gallinaceum]
MKKMNEENLKGINNKENVNQNKPREIVNSYNDITDIAVVSGVSNKNEEYICNINKENENVVIDNSYTKHKNEGIINIENNSNDNISTSIINKSIRIINDSIYNIKNNLTSIKNIINLNEESEEETISENYKSDESSIVKTFENLKDDEYLDSKNNEDLELLLKTVINTKKEEKQFTTLDIIDECISIGNIYSINKSKQLLNKDNNSVIKNENLTNEKKSSFENSEVDDNYVEDINLDNLDNLDKFLKINKVKSYNEYGIESTSNCSLNTSNFQTEQKKNTKNKSGNLYKDTLYKFKDFLQNEENKLTYLLKKFLKKKKLNMLLKDKKKICYFILHLFFFFSYAFFAIFFIFLKRIFYHIIFDQDL